MLDLDSPRWRSVLHPDAVEKQLRRTVGLNGQEAWADQQPQAPAPSGGGAMSMPPPPGAMTGGEPPRWDSAQQTPRTASAPGDADDGMWPEGRTVPPRSQRPFPAPYMDGYWPGGGHGTRQAGVSSPSSTTGVPPRGMGAKKRISLADLVKVGPEGYIHGYICVRPPCGPKYAQAVLDKRKGQVLHDGVKIGKVPSKDADGKYSAIHYGTDAAGVEVRSKLPARFDTAQQAFDAIPVYHNLTKLAAEDTPADVKAHLENARQAFANGDVNAAAEHLQSASVGAFSTGDMGLGNHIEHVRTVLSGEDGIEPTPVTGGITPARDELPPGETLYHGSGLQFSPGDIIAPEHMTPEYAATHGGNFAFASADIGQASAFGDADAERRGAGSGHLYRVTPVGDYERDKFMGGPARRSAQGFRVEEELTPYTGEAKPTAGDHPNEDKWNELVSRVLGGDRNPAVISAEGNAHDTMYERYGTAGASPEHQEEWHQVALGSYEDAAISHGLDPETGSIPPGEANEDGLVNGHRVTIAPTHPALPVRTGRITGLAGASVASVEYDDEPGVQHVVSAYRLAHTDDRQDPVDELWASSAGTANLTDAEKESIGKAYYSVQGPFTQHILRYPAESERAGLRLSPEEQQGVDTLKRAIASAEPFDQPVTLYQGTVRATKLYGETGSKIGQTVMDQGFMSTSASHDEAENYIGLGPLSHDRAMIVVHAQPGARALKADESIMTRAGNEPGTADRLREYTFAPGTPLRIISDAKTGPGGRREIHVEIGPHDVVTAPGASPEHAPKPPAGDLPPVAPAPSREDELTELARDPKAFDTQLAEHHAEEEKASARVSALTAVVHRLVGDRQGYVGRKRVWGLSDADAIAHLQQRVAAGKDRYDTTIGTTPSAALAALDAAKADLQKVSDQIDAHAAVYRKNPWPRFFPCRSAGGHIHSSLQCSTLRADTPMGWAPHLSGKTEAEAVADLDDALCSVCFPSAPVALQRYVPRGPKAERDKREAERAVRAEARAAKTLTEEEQFRDHSGHWVTTVHGAKEAIRGELDAAAYFPRLFAEGKYTQAARDAERVLLAREAAKPGTGATAEEIAKMRASTRKRIKRESGIDVPASVGTPAVTAEPAAPVPAPTLTAEQTAAAATPLPEVPEAPPFVPAKPQRVVSHTQLDAQRIASDLDAIYADRDKVPGVPSYHMPGNNLDYLARNLTRGKEEEFLYPRDTTAGGEHQDAQALRILNDEIKRFDRMLSTGMVAEYSRDRVPPAARPMLTSMRDRIAALRDEVAAADTSTPFQQGDFTRNTRKALSGGFDDHLTADQRVALRELIDDKNLSYEESSRKDEKLKALKNAFTEKTLLAAGLPDNAASVIARYGVDDLISSWAMSGDEAQKISNDYMRGMAMTEPPELRVTDFAGKRSDQYKFSGPEADYSDMSSEAQERRRLALDYWVPRAQQHYTNQVLNEVNPAGKPVKAVRYVYGHYADAIKSANARGDRWTAQARLLSSWSEPKGATTAKAFVRHFGDPLRLEQVVDPSQIFAHWRGEGTLRNGVRVKGEIIVRDSKLSSDTTNVVEPPKPPPPAPKRPRW